MTKKKSRKLRKKRVFGLFLIIILIALIEVTFSNKKELKKPKSIIPKTKEEEKIETKKLSLVMVGDALIHGSVYRDAYKDGKYDFSHQLEFIKPIIKNYDLAFYNQETILGGTELGLSDYPTFNSPWEFGDNMLDAGFNIVNLATNHTIDRGEKAILKSCEYWNPKKKDILFAGSYCSFDDQNEIKIFEKNGIKYTMLSYTYGTNGIPVPKGKEYLVNLYSDEQAKKDIEKVRDKVDVLLISMHWGIEYQTEPTAEQKREAEYLSSLGADIIIGTHPHIIEPVTYINDTLVIYSLGNFISAQSTNNDYNTMVELMTSVDIIKETKSGKSTIKLENLNNELLYNYYTKGSGRWYNFKVIPFSMMNTNYNSDYKRLYDKYSKVVKLYDENIPVKEAA